MIAGRSSVLQDLCGPSKTRSFEDSVIRSPALSVSRSFAHSITRSVKLGLVYSFDPSITRMVARGVARTRLIRTPKPHDAQRKARTCMRIDLVIANQEFAQMWYEMPLCKQWTWLYKIVIAQCSQKAHNSAILPAIVNPYRIYFHNVQLNWERNWPCKTIFTFSLG